MAKAQLDGSQIQNWDSCMSRFSLASGEVLELEISNSQSVKRDAPEVLEALVDNVRFVNDRYVERGKAPMLRLVLK